MKNYEKQNIRRRIGCDPETYENALARQLGKCALCRRLPGHKKLRPDKKRVGELKLLCSNCLYIADLRASEPGLIVSYLDLGDYKSATDF